MTLPKQIKVGGLTVAIREVHNLAHERERMAEYCPWDCEIRVDDDLTDCRKWASVIHELIECIVAVNEIQISHQDISIIANQLHQVLTDNSLTWGNNK